MKLIFLSFFICLLDISLQKSTPGDDYYVAAVVEFQASSNATKNVQDYIWYIEQARKEGADIIVFPEMALTGLSTVTLPVNTLLKKWPTPAISPQKYNKILVAISKAAKDNDIYVVVNIRENLDCTRHTGEYCPEEKQYIFNTNVVFDRRGAVIDRYRKINPFQEPSHTASLQSELGVFSTDFGVTSVYILTSLMPELSSNSAIQEDIPVQALKGADLEHNDLLVTVDPSLVTYITKELVPGYQEFTLIDKEISCSFKVMLGGSTGKDPPIFMAAARDGIVSYSGTVFGISTCTVTACKTYDVKTCAYWYNPKDGRTSIINLQIVLKRNREQINSTDQNIIYYPMSVKTDMLPLHPNNFTYKATANKESIQNTYATHEGKTNKRTKYVFFKLNNPQTNLISFGIWGRNFGKDRVNLLSNTTLDVLDIVFDADKIALLGNTLTTR